MRILVVEDEPDLQDVLTQMLREDGFAVDAAGDGQTALRKAAAADYDVIVLDLMLPVLSGWDMLRALRESRTTPVLIVTARDAMPDRVRGLDAGADDYLTKPFELDELRARVRAILRRSGGRTDATLRLGDVTLNTTQRTASRHGQDVALTPREYALVELLVANRGRLVSRNVIYTQLFDDSLGALSNLVDVHVAHVRQKLGRDFIVTRRGEGYMVDA